MRYLVIVALAAGLLVSACDRKAEGQTVAVVNGEEITAADLNAELAGANLPPGLAEAQARSRVLEAMIDRRLLAQQARKEGLDKSPEFLNRQRRMTEDLLIGMLASRQLNTAELPSESEIVSFEASNPGMFGKREHWNLEQLIYPTPSERAVNARIVATKTLEELAQVLTQSGIRFTRAQNRFDTATMPPDMYERVASLPPGEPFIVPAGGRTVASAIVSREPATLAGDAARPVATMAIRRNQGSKLMENRLKSLRSSAKIEYQQGYAPPK